MRFDSICNICGSSEFRRLAERYDGIPVIACVRCGHGVVEHFPFDMDQLYSDQYFAAEPAAEYGYTDYEYTAEHGVAWAAALVRLLLPAGGRILDIGCADGHLLRKLPTGFDRFGIEPNAHAAEQAAAAGIHIAASDVLDPALHRTYGESFDAVLAIASFEHIVDFRGAVESAMGLLKPGGVLLFEVPLITEDGKPDTWFRTSLEHIHYPSERSLVYLFHDVLGVELAGSSLDIKDFAYTYIGAASKSSGVMRRVRDDFRRWLTASPASLSPEEARFRWLLDLIHAGNATPEVLALYRHIEAGDWNPPLVRRIFELWMAQARRGASIEQYLGEVEKARDWHAEETRKRDAIIKAAQAGVPAR